MKYKVPAIKSKRNEARNARGEYSFDLSRYTYFFSIVVPTNCTDKMKDRTSAIVRANLFILFVL